jgi:hypothetical protein
MITEAISVFATRLLETAGFNRKIKNGWTMLEA